MIKVTIVAVALAIAGCGLLEKKGVLEPGDAEVACADALRTCAAATAAMPDNEDIKKFCTGVVVACAGS